MQAPIFFGNIGTDLAGIAQKTMLQFGVDWGHFIAQCISFGIVVLCLQKFAYKPILAVLEERRQRIKEGLENADKVKQELANAQAKSQEMLQKTGLEAAKMIEAARAAAAKVQEQETQKAIAAAQAIVDKARQATEAEHARMLADLRRELGRLVVEATTKVTGKVLTPEDQKRLIDDTNRELIAKYN